MTGSSGFPFSCWGVFMCDYSYFKIQNKQTLMSKRVGRPLVFNSLQYLVLTDQGLFECGMHILTHTYRILCSTCLVRQSYMKWLLLLLLLFRSQRMFRSEPRKPLNFPQRARKEEEEDRWREKKEWQSVCQMRKGGKMKRSVRFPAVLHWLLKGLFAAAAPPFSFNPTPPRSQTSNSLQFSTWPKLF